MRADELRGRRVAIWGYGREGRAAVRFLRARDLGAALTILDDAAESEANDGAPVIRGRAAIVAAMTGFDVVVKSPGISLYDPLVREAKARGVRFTSLLNLWFAAGPPARTICVTGTKGKSTTTALIVHVLRGVGRTAALAGNIGIPVTEIPGDVDVAVIEVSSYQAADFDGLCDLAVLTSLAQEHLDWHGSVAVYHWDKLNLLRHARHSIINAEAVADVRRAIDLDGLDHTLFDPQADVRVANRYLARPHNRSNLLAALAVMHYLGVDRAEALRAAEDFPPLPHRQQEIGEVDGVLYVDDSISTTPESAIAALEVYRDRDVTLIAGGYDRGIDYHALVERLHAAPPRVVLLLDASGRRIHELLMRDVPAGMLVRRMASMRDAVGCARELTPRGGVVLLSPAAPSYGSYRSFIERGEDFARCAGLGEGSTAKPESR